MDLRTYFPTVEAVVGAPLVHLAGAILEVLKRTEPGQLHLGNFTIQTGRYVYGSYEGGAHDGVVMACAEAWNWLLANGFICPKPDNAGWVFITRKGAAINGVEGFAAWVSAQELPPDMVHPKIATLSLPLFLQGRYDTAVFEAFKELEVSIRETAGLGNNLVGVQLASRAFHKDDGELSDLSAEGGERTALMSLMAGSIGSYKNPHSHRKVSIAASEAREMLLLASHLLRIVEARGESRRARLSASSPP